MLVGVETGGTSIRVGLARQPSRPVAARSLATGDPGRTLGELRRALLEITDGCEVDAVGVAAFGPVDVNPTSATYGVIGATPKPGWRGVDLRGLVATTLAAPVYLDTDVNAAALAEQRWGVGNPSANVSYVTVGTGVGVGAVVDGRLLHGTSHPELGHLLVRRHPDDSFEGVCPFHGDCAEGLASGPALARRWGRDPADLADLLVPARAMEAFYLAQMVLTLVYALSPDLVVLAGGVAAMPGLHEQVADVAAGLLAGARGDHPLASGRPFVRRSALGGQAGLVGALTLAHDGLASSDV